MIIQLTSKSCKILFIFIILFFISLIGCQDREFEYQSGVFITDWLICGPFPNCEDCSLTDYKHGANCTGFYTDYLTSIGGERQALPAIGINVEYPQRGLQRKWFPYHSISDYIPLNDIVTPNDTVVSYAFCQVHSPLKQKTILAVGSNDGIQVFLNGKKVHENHPRNGRWLQKDNDYIPVELQAGQNNLMLKIDEGGGDYGFVARFLDYDSTVTEIRKNIEKYKTLTLVAIEDTLSARFGEPFKISTLNPDGQVNIEIVHEKAGKIMEQTTSPGTEVRFPLEGIPEGFFTAQASFMTPQDGNIKSETRHFKGKLARHPRPERLNRNLLPLSEKNQPFFPIGTYGAPPEEYQVIKEAGYNFVVASVNNLDKVQEAGLKAAVPVHGSKPKWFSEVRETISRYKDHPAVLCWMLYDEPGYNRADLLDIYQLYNIAYETDPVNPSYLVITTPSVYETFGRCCDILAVDTYPIAQGDITQVGANIARAYQESDGDLPVWHCGQLFKWPAQRRPTVQEHRFMTYISLIEGAKGLLWYTYKGYGQHLSMDDPELWEYHKQLLNEVHELAPLFMEHGFGKRILLTKDNPNMRGIQKSCELGSFIIAANQSDTEILSPEFLIKSKLSGQVSVYGENRTIAVEKGLFRDQFSPLDVHIYKLPD